MAQYPQWNSKTSQLSAVSKLIAGEVYKVVIAANGFEIKNCSAVNAKCEIGLSDKANSIYELRITSEANGLVRWIINFEKWVILRNIIYNGKVYFILPALLAPLLLELYSLIMQKVQRPVKDIFLYEEVKKLSLRPGTNPSRGKNRSHIMVIFSMSKNARARGLAHVC